MGRNMTTFKQLIKSIEDNNRINAAEWADWPDYGSILDVYGPFNDADVDEEDAYRVISNAIRSNGVTLAEDLREIGARIYGQEFAGPFFWFRGEA
jgi:hypothetical protein